MYIPDLNLFLVNVPKCGTNTLDMAVRSLYGECLPGHVPVTVARQILGHDFTAWALIRDPWERFASAMNFIYGDTDTHLDDAMNGALRHQTIVMKSQAYFVDEATRLFPFEALPEVLRLVGYFEEIPHENRSFKRWTTKEIRAHARAGEVAERYADDFALRAAVSHGGDNPNNPFGQR
jgi:hypothetical protein